MAQKRPQGRQHVRPVTVLGQEQAGIDESGDKRRRLGAVALVDQRLLAKDRQPRTLSRPQCREVVLGRRGDYQSVDPARAEFVDIRHGWTSCPRRCASAAAFS